MVKVVREKSPQKFETKVNLMLSLGYQADSPLVVLGSCLLMRMVRVAEKNEEFKGFKVFATKDDPSIEKQRVEAYQNGFVPWSNDVALGNSLVSTYIKLEEAEQQEKAESKEEIEETEVEEK